MNEAEIAMKNFVSRISIDEYSITPKYVQLINSILQGMQSGQIKKDDVLPSINELSLALDTPRNTVERAYKELKKRGMVQSIAGKGYFITTTEFNQPLKVMLLFNKLSMHKKIIYDAFSATLGSDAAIDFYIYNNDFHVFKRLLDEKIDLYTKCVIIPHFTENKEIGYKLIDKVPKNKLILLDKMIDSVGGDFGAIYENFEADIFFALEQLRTQLNKYNTLKIIFPKKSYHSVAIVNGFKRFCENYTYQHEIIDCLDNEKIQAGIAYINLMEEDLVELIQRIIEKELKVGRDVGVISYNETPLKKIILDGITTISTDFKMMGEKAAQMVMDNSTEHIEIPIVINLRNSL